MKSERTLKLNIKATLENVDCFCEKAEKLLRKNNLDDYIFPVQMLLREVLTNAVVHGCRKKPDLMIKSTIIICKNEIIIDVEDPGDGFDWKIYKDKDYSCSAESGRGLLILKKYASAFEYNETGNIVIIKKNIVQKEKDHEHKQYGEKWGQSSANA